MTISKTGRSPAAQPPQPTRAPKSAPRSEAAAAAATTGKGWVPGVASSPTRTWGPYGITRQPAAEDWNFESSVRAFQKDVPAKVRDAMSSATDAQLRKGLSRSWTQEISHGGKTEKMTVELTQKLIPVPYETFMARLPPDQWGGPNLARSLGGEVKVLETDAQGRPTKQVERMVLAQDDLLPHLGPLGRSLAGKFANDMTKTETITRGADRSRVDWRVFGSDNGSTLADLGSVTFERRGQGTLVTFHSAHKLGVPGSNVLGGKPLPIPAELIGLPLQSAFLAHANRYAAIVEGAKGGFER